jgi:DNA-binding transcriptional MerR regulator
MGITIHHIDREFSPSEAEAITGLSATLQRDWRRRGFLPENKDGKWTRFSLSHIIEMFVMKALSDAGFSVSAVTKHAHAAILPTLEFLYRLPGSVVFEGEEISEELKQEIIDDLCGGLPGRYIVVFQGANGDAGGLRLPSLDNLDVYMAERKTAHVTLIDCELLANTIAERAGSPIHRITAERLDDEK